MSRRNTDERQVQIVAAARRVVARRGWAGATTNRIAREAQLTPGLLHYHFDGKKQILVALLETIVEERVQAALDAADSAEGHLDRLDAVLRAHLSALGRDDSRVWASIVAEAAHDQELARVFMQAEAALIETIRAVVHEGRAAGAFGVEGMTSEQVATAITTWVEGGIGMRAVNAGDGSSARQLEALRRLAEALLDLDTGTLPRRGPEEPA